jgi:membrane-associated phospholipid phosphatase
MRQYFSFILLVFYPLFAGAQIDLHADDHHDPAEHAEEHIYNWNWNKDGLVLATSVGAWGISNFLKSSADKIQASDIDMLNASNIWGFDIGAIDNYNLSAGKSSDYLLFGTFFMPLTHYFGHRCREQKFAIAGMMIESFFVADGIVNVLKATTKRFRPFIYNPDIPIEEKLNNQSRYSFVSGHTSNTAMIGFFSAKVFSDLYPDSKWKPFIWGAAITVPALTGYMRYKAGKHFPTDIIGGYLIGASVGYLVPHFHKISGENMHVNILPTQGGMMLALNKTF